VVQYVVVSVGTTTPSGDLVFGRGKTIPVYDRAKRREDKTVAVGPALEAELNHLGVDAMRKVAALSNLLENLGVVKLLPPGQRTTQCVHNALILRRKT
jgi:hypothetical protein